MVPRSADFSHATRHSRTRSFVIRVLILCLVVVAGCATGDELTDEVERLRQTIVDQQREQALLGERLNEIETIFSDDQGDELGELEGRLATLDDRLDEVDTGLAQLADETEAAASSRAQIAAELDTIDQDLRSAIAGLRETLEQVQGEVAIVSDQVQILREIMDR